MNDYNFYYSKLTSKCKFFFLDGIQLLHKKHYLHFDEYTKLYGKDATLLYLKRLLEID